LSKPRCCTVAALKDVACRSIFRQRQGGCDELCKLVLSCREGEETMRQPWSENDDTSESRFWLCLGAELRTVSPAIQPPRECVEKLRLTLTLCSRTACGSHSPAILATGTVRWAFFSLCTRSLSFGSYVLGGKLVTGSDCLRLPKTTTGHWRWLVSPSFVLPPSICQPSVVEFMDLLK